MGDAPSRNPKDRDRVQFCDVPGSPTKKCIEAMFKGPITDDEELKHLHRFLQGLGSIDVDSKAMKGDRPEAFAPNEMSPDQAGGQVAPRKGGEVESHSAVSGTNTEVLASGAKTSSNKADSDTKMSSKPIQRSTLSNQETSASGDS